MVFDFRLSYMSATSHVLINLLIVHTIMSAYCSIRTMSVKRIAPARTFLLSFFESYTFQHSLLFIIAFAVIFLVAVQGTLLLEHANCYACVGERPGETLLCSTLLSVFALGVQSIELTC